MGTAGRGVRDAEVIDGVISTTPGFDIGTYERSIIAKNTREICIRRAKIRGMLDTSNWRIRDELDAMWELCSLVTSLIEKQKW